jgi:hypothetical protein
MLTLRDDVLRHRVLRRPEVRQPVAAAAAAEPKGATAE